MNGRVLGVLFDVDIADSLDQPAAHPFPSFHIVGVDAPRLSTDALTNRERSFHRGLAIGVILTRALWRSDAFREQVAVARSASSRDVLRERAWGAAAAYAAGETPGRRLVASLIAAAALLPVEHLPGALEQVWQRPIIDREDPGARNFRRVTENTTLRARRGAGLIARRGADACLVEGCQTPRATTRHVTRVAGGKMRTYNVAKGSKPYCATHYNDALRHSRDAKAIENTFRAAVEAFPSPAEQRLLRWWWGRRGLAA